MTRIPAYQIPRPSPRPIQIPLPLEIDERPWRRPEPEKSEEVIWLN